LYEIDLRHTPYGMGTILKAFEFMFEDTFTSLWTLYRGYIDNLDKPIIRNYEHFKLKIFFILVLTFIFTAINTILSYFLIAAIIDSYKKISQNISQQKYFSHAVILYENIHTLDEKEMMKTPYVFMIKR